MIVEAIKRCMLGIAYSGLITFSIITILHFTETETSVSQIWSHMLYSLLLGIYFGLASFIFGDNDWSILKQTVTHFVLSISFYYMIALSAGWVSLTFSSVFWTSIMFVLIYVVFWFGHYLYYKRLEKIMNAHLSEKD
ncbi:hypothetical protein J416_02349 [Gracilibacillus halophilus YIM-C55.5]|uniref:DUF3021 domain-containing protein n=1 Tax=Gracilibacillus halophilus YIM-C55.5 TaxID=1308866 RepID=N4WPL9_9BACI|nr:DUF3021 domain-containing protein [Gracilibacillus halophilus]ENH98047.1 hypothetical protein J416_02349 [Gracilibacillus halophilus YIM-C55.5]